MADDSTDVAKVQVKFKTLLVKYKVTEKPFQVPVNLNRRGLSQVINHLLGNSMYYMFLPDTYSIVCLELTIM